MPSVTDCSSPSGLPNASTTSPARRSSESPISRKGSPCRAIRRTARSVSSSTPTSAAGTASPGGGRIELPSPRSRSSTWIERAPATTCALVTTRPSGVRMTPEPIPRCGARIAAPLALDGTKPVAEISTTAGPTRAASSRSASEKRTEPARDVAPRSRGLRGTGGRGVRLAGRPGARWRGAPRRGRGRRQR